MKIGLVFVTVGAAFLAKEVERVLDTSRYGSQLKLNENWLCSYMSVLARREISKGRVLKAKNYLDYCKKSRNGRKSQRLQKYLNGQKKPKSNRN